MVSVILNMKFAVLFYYQSEKKFIQWLPFLQIKKDECFLALQESMRKDGKNILFTASICANEFLKNSNYF